MQLTICPLCGGELLVETRYIEYGYQGYYIWINQPGSYCKECGEGFLSPEDNKTSKEDISNFIEKVDKKEKDLKNLVKLLRRSATLSWKKVQRDLSHYEGMCKGMYIGYEEAASRLEKIIKRK